MVHFTIRYNFLLLQKENNDEKGKQNTISYLLNGIVGPPISLHDYVGFPIGKTQDCHMRSILSIKEREENTRNSLLQRGLFSLAIRT